MAFVLIPESNIQGSIAKLVGTLQGSMIRMSKQEARSIELLLTDCKNVSKCKKQVDTIDRFVLASNKKIAQFEKLISTLEAPVKGMNILIEVLSSLPIPQSVPPGIGIPMSITLTFSRLIQTLRELVKQVEITIRAIESVLSGYKTVAEELQVKLEKIKLLIKLCEINTEIEAAIVNCRTPEEKLVELGIHRLDGTPTLVQLKQDYSRNLITKTTVLSSLESIKINLKRIPCVASKVQLNLSPISVAPNASSELTSYQAKNGQIYTLKIIKEERGDYVTFRNYAVAENNMGIIVLQGPKSFSSNTEILIEELKFRLDQLL